VDCSASGLASGGGVGGTARASPVIASPHWLDDLIAPHSAPAGPSTDAFSALADFALPEPLRAPVAAGSTPPPGTLCQVLTRCALPCAKRWRNCIPNLRTLAGRSQSSAAAVQPGKPVLPPPARAAAAPSATQRAPVHLAPQPPTRSVDYMRIPDAPDNPFVLPIPLLDLLSFEEPKASVDPFAASQPPACAPPARALALDPFLPAP